MPRGSQPGERRGGRQKGTPNKLSRDLREMVEGALADAGGQQYLTRQAHENPTAFLALLKGLLPKQLSADVTTRADVTERRALMDEIVGMLMLPGADATVLRAPIPARAANVPRIFSCSA